MGDPIYRALVVDDEPAVRRLAMDSLACEGFVCDAAADGRDAKELLEHQAYDLVVTDLRMPNCHGHSLAVELLGLEARPVVAVLTGVAEPRLAKDLIARGVDEIAFKPVDFVLFGAKLRALVNRRLVGVTDARNNGNSQLRADDSTPVIDAAELEAKLAHVSRILPLRPTALEVYQLAGDPASVTEQIATALRRDGPLAVEVLRLANSSLHNPAGEKIAQLEDAVLRVGQKCVGELALASNALATLTAAVLPWIDGDALARRTTAAGLALEALVSEGRHRNLESGLMLGVMVHALGRVALGTIFPQSYDQMLAEVKAANGTLAECERAVFGESQSAVMARLLRMWRLPQEMYLPLKYIEDWYPALVRLPEPLRTKTELIKVAILVGQIATGSWAPWDTLELPSPVLLKRLRIESLSEVLQRVRDALQGDGFLPEDLPRDRALTPDVPCRTLTYYNLAGGTEDLLGLVIENQDIKLHTTSKAINEAPAPVLINCLDAPMHRLSARWNPKSPVSPMIVCHPDAAEKCAQLGTVVSIPGSFGALKQLLESA